MAKQKFRKLKLDKAQLSNLPIGYQFITSSEMVDGKQDFDEAQMYFYDLTYNAVLHYTNCKRLISKIIDFEKIKINFDTPNSNSEIE
jgi:hypothetical protein